MELTFDWTKNLTFGPSPAATRHNTPSATEKQIATYQRLCAEKHIQPMDTSAWSKDQASAEIQRIIDMHLLSEDQRALIKAKIDHLRELGCTTEFPDSEINKLTGGRDGTASKFIDQLMKLEQRYMVNAPVTEDQLKTLVSWYYCPDIPFEEFNVPLTMATEIELDGIKMKRKLTPEEFAKEIQKNFTFQSAREFIQHYRVDFYDWRKTRITIGQMNRIRELEARMADISSPSIVDLSVDIDGEPVLIQVPVADRINKWNPTAYIPIGEAELLMYSQEEATRLIVQMQSELRNPELRSFGEPPAYEDLIDAKRDASGDKVMEKEVEKLNNIMFSLMAALGEREDDLEHEEVRLVVERWAERLEDEQVQALIDRIADMMVFAVDEGFISEEHLMELIGESTIAVAIYEVNW